MNVVKKTRRHRKGKKRDNGDLNSMHNQGSSYGILSRHQDEDNQTGAGKQPMVSIVNEIRENMVTNGNKGWGVDIGVGSS